MTRRLLTVAAAVLIAWLFTATADTAARDRGIEWGSIPTQQDER